MTSVIKNCVGTTLVALHDKYFMNNAYKTIKHSQKHT